MGMTRITYGMLGKMNSFWGQLVVATLWLSLSVLLLTTKTLLVSAAREDWPELVLDKRIVGISLISAQLSNLAYADSTSIEQWMTSENDTTTGFPTYEHPDYDYINFYTEEPEQAIVAKKEGRCYLAFRGTNANPEDWAQNLDLSEARLYKDNIDTGNTADACVVRAGFTLFLSTSVVARGRADLQTCVETCDDPDDCLVITGHSQGGAESLVAAITLYSLNPIVVTFGQPPTADPNCLYVMDNRYYRYVNWIEKIGDKVGVAFDPIVYTPNLFSGAEHYGYNILVGEDPTSVYYAGYGPDIELNPLLVHFSVAAHSMGETNYSYESRIGALFDNLPNIGTDGSVDGTVCSWFYRELCVSKSCVKAACADEGEPENDEPLPPEPNETSSPENDETLPPQTDEATKPPSKNKAKNWCSLFGVPYSLLPL